MKIYVVNYRIFLKIFTAILVCHLPFRGNWVTTGTDKKKKKKKFRLVFTQIEKKTGVHQIWLDCRNTSQLSKWLFSLSGNMFNLSWDNRASTVY